MGRMRILAARDRVYEQLAGELPESDALERANNIAQALSLRFASAQQMVEEMLADVGGADVSETAERVVQAWSGAIFSAANDPLEEVDADRA